MFPRRTGTSPANASIAPTRPHPSALHLHQGRSLERAPNPPPAPRRPSLERAPTHSTRDGASPALRRHHEGRSLASISRTPDGASPAWAALRRRPRPSAEAGTRPLDNPPSTTPATTSSAYPTNMLVYCSYRLVGNYETSLQKSWPKSKRNFGFVRPDQPTTIIRQQLRRMLCIKKNGGCSLLIQDSGEPRLVAPSFVPFSGL